MRSTKSPNVVMMLRKSMLAAAAVLGLAAAQVHSDCNPMESNCPANPAFGTSHLFHFNSTPDSALWETTAGIVNYDAKNGASFTIAKQGDSPTIRTRFYFFFGRTEIWLKVASGRGIISSMMWLSDDLDEVDWEFLGSNKSFATTNYFGKGRQDYKNGGSHHMSGMQDDFHNYTTLWTKDSIQWFIDGGLVRTLDANDANKTHNYPQTPMRMSVGIWAGGDPSLPEGTRQWAGGDTDYASGPFTMNLRSAQITDFSTGREYTYGDRSGSWESIKMTAGNSTAMDVLSQPPDKTLAQKWAELPSGAKAAVYGGGAAVAGLALAALVWYYLRQRRLGAAEATAAQERELRERRENEEFQKRGLAPDQLSVHGQGYNARDYHAGRDSDSLSYHGQTATNPFEVLLDEKTRLGSSASSVTGMLAAAAGPASSSPGRHHLDLGGPPSPSVPPPSQRPDLQSRSPLMGSQSPHSPQSPSLPFLKPSRQHQMRNISAPGGYSRIGSPGPQESYGMQLLQSPAATSQQRSFSDNHKRGYGYRG